MVSTALANAIMNVQPADIAGSFEKGQKISRDKNIKRLSGLALSGDGDSFDELGKYDQEGICLRPRGQEEEEVILT